MKLVVTYVLLICEKQVFLLCAWLYREGWSCRSRFWSTTQKGAPLSPPWKWDLSSGQGIPPLQRAAKRRLSDNVDGLRQVGLCSVHPVHAIRVLLHELPEKPSFLFSLPSENLTFTFDFGIHSLPHSAPEICSCSIFNFSCTFCK